MFCQWQVSKLGGYIIGDKIIGLDYKNLFLDPQQTNLTIFHEAIHAALNKTTEFGVGTDDFYRLSRHMTKVKKEDRDRIKKALYKNQIFVQEGTASLIEILHLKRLHGKKYALNWANKYFPPDYLERFNKLTFVLDFSIKYQDYFTGRIPHVAMQTDIRKQIVEQDLLSDVDRFIQFLGHEDNNPNKRFEKLIEKVKYNGAISKRLDNDICDATGTKFFDVPSKSDIAGFLNYMLSFTDVSSPPIKESDISEAITGKDVFIEAGEKMIIGNMNINLAESGIVEWRLEDFLHYKDKINGVLVSVANIEDETRDIIEKHLLRRKYEAGLIAFLKSGEKIVTGVEIKSLPEILNKELSHSTLLVKWGLYRPGANQLLHFVGVRLPDVVIYNNISDLEKNFQDYFLAGKQASYIVVQASEDHPFQTLLLKDENDILHLVNVFIKHLNPFISKYKDSSIQNRPLREIVVESKHFNNVSSIWNGLPWHIDWYKSMLDGRNLFFR